MSQQHMDFDEINHRQQDPPYATGYGDPFVSSHEQQKLSSQNTGAASRGVPAGMRLALAIVSVSILIPISAITLSMGDSPMALFKALIGLGMICLTIMVVNIVFNFKR
ncbi:MAG TPA: hypothetical protein VL485_18995 [Ktedonobacteraceae bacterium]|jgi:hypothetical protein|nr:hypothetical protein [Ktedonobacteraceae bacterium]